MSAMNLRVNEGCQDLPLPFWDSVWSVSNGAADWALAGPSETQNVGGLQATQALETAVINCLFCDKYCPPNHPLARFADPYDLRGWWGDGVDLRADLGEAELGSRLWTLERAYVTDEIALLAAAEARDALAPLLTQTLVARIDVTAYPVPPRNALGLQVNLFGGDGTKVFGRRFDNVWTQLAANGVSVAA